MGKTAFLFPGQGAQHVGMARDLCANFPAARDLFEKASNILDYDLAQLCAEGPIEKLDSTVISQPALFVSSMAALERIRSESPHLMSACEYAAGLSLGEYTALTFAGVLEFENAVRVVKTRGEAMQAAADQTPSGMVSILGMELSQIEELCQQVKGDDVLRVANHLSPGNIVVSGTKAACARVVEAATEAGAMRVIPLAVAGAFHTSIMQSAVEKLSAALADVPLSKPRFPVVSNVDAMPHFDPEEIREILVRQVVHPVHWEDSMRRLLADGVDNFCEIGPGRVLRGLLRRIERKAKCENYS